MMQRFNLVKKVLNANQTITRLVLKKSVITNDLRYFHESKYLSKKLGHFSDLTHEKGEMTKKVKLYPGFQVSHEEMRQKLELENTFSAKQVIEDFYGLNTLEYDNFEEKKEESLIECDDKETSFDIELAINALKKENVQDICCIEVPSELNYADHMIIGTCLSDRHLNAAFIAMNRKYKKLKTDKSQFLRRKLSRETKWCALDTGSIVIHLFLPEYRETYDLESLWSCGSEFDEKCHEFKSQQDDFEKKLLVVDEP